MKPGNRVSFLRHDDGRPTAGIVLRVDDDHNRRTVVLLDSGEVCAGFRDEDLTLTDVGDPDDVDPQVWEEMAEGWGADLAAEYRARAKILPEAHRAADQIRIIDGPRKGARP